MATAKETTATTESAVGGKTPGRAQSVNTPTYKSVKLKKAVEYKGQVYRPGIWHVMDATMVAALADKILEEKPHETESFYIRKAS